jgi:hypothetical protein
MFNFFKNRKLKKQQAEVGSFLNWLANHERDPYYSDAGAARMINRYSPNCRNMIADRIDNPIFRAVVSNYPNLDVANNLLDSPNIYKLDRYEIAGALKWVSYIGLNHIYSEFGRSTEADVNNERVYKAFIRRCKTIILFSTDESLIFHERIFKEDA